MEFSLRPENKGTLFIVCTTHVMEPNDALVLRVRDDPALEVDVITLLQAAPVDVAAHIQAELVGVCCRRCGKGMDD